MAESRVLLIMTGGTICMKSSELGLVPTKDFVRNAMLPRPSFNDGTEVEELTLVDQGVKKSSTALRTPSSVYGRQIRYCALEYEELLDSSSIDSTGWARIAGSIMENYEHFDGFVVLHGTDSLAYTCSALSFMFSDLGKPIIFTGSQTSIFQLQNDATDNLLGAMIIAGHFTIPEVCLFFNNKLFRGNRTTKIAASEFDAFASPNFPPLATVDSSGATVLWHLIHRPTHVRRVSLRTNLDTAAVACLRVFPGIRPEMVEAVLRSPGLHGLVLETFGAGNAPGGSDNALTKVLEDAVSRGIVVVNITQCLSGNVSSLYATGTSLARVGVVVGRDQTSEAALTKLAYLLGSSDTSSAAVASQMSVSLRGELSEVSQAQFRHADMYGTASGAEEYAELATLIMAGEVNKLRKSFFPHKKWLLDEVDYMGNTPLHIAALAPEVGIIQELLVQGSLVHTRNKAGATPYTLALNAGHSEHVKVLLAAGAHA